MAPDRRLVDQHQVELARQAAQACREYVEQQLGLNTLRPPTGRTLLHRLQRLHALQNQLEQLLAALLTSSG